MAENCCIRIIQMLARSEVLALVRRGKKRHRHVGKSMPRFLLQAVYFVHAPIPGDKHTPLPARC